ncbi:MAG TPA: glycosyltransferase [Thermoanaerobaculia bacterium]|jgi:GT2 family glycosyltransferase|nr:glycosyltransferase [Thermoanaerobaculia bacterium]
MHLAVILVHYRTPELAVEAVEAVRADLAGTGIEAEWLLVDNGSDAEGRARLASLPVRRIDPGENLGYAGGVNLGVAHSTADALLVMNPDVLVIPGCVPALLDRLRAGAAVAGPAFFWDRGRRMRLPPAEIRSRREELLTVLAGRDERWAARARRRWRRHARRHWEARAPFVSYSLSGSLLAIRRDAWERVGPFDGGFRLFFEETDWLLRARRLGLRSEHVAAAEAVHLYNQSAALEPQAQEWFEESARRFRRSHYGVQFASFLEILDRRMPRRRVLDLPEVPEAGLSLPAQAEYPLWVEVSPAPQGFPAAGERIAAPAGSWRLPEEIRKRMPDGRWRVQVTDREGREIVRGSLAPGERLSAERGVA